MGKVYCIASVKGGTGKTTTAVNLGISFSKIGKKVLLIDGNIDGANVGFHLGVSSRNLNTLHDILNGRANVWDSIYTHPSGMNILLGGTYLRDLEVKNFDFLKIINEVKHEYDIILLDTSSGIGESVKSAIRACDEVIIVTNPELPAVADALKIVELAEELWIPISGVILNKYDSDDLNDLSVEDVETILGKPVIGIIPEDYRIKESIYIRSPIVHEFPNSKISKSFINLAAKIAGVKIEKESGFIERLMEFVSKLKFF